MSDVLIWETKHGEEWEHTSIQNIKKNDIFRVRPPNGEWQAWPETEETEYIASADAKEIDGVWGVTGNPPSVIEGEANEEEPEGDVVAQTQ